MVDDEQSGTLGRAFRIGKLSAGIAGSYLGYQIQNLVLDRDASREKRRGLDRRASEKIRREMQHLRGPVMKLGQALSMQDNALPEEFIEELSHLQMQAPAMHPTLMRAQFRRAMGKDPEKVFADFEPEPFAAASLGQVHRATTKKGERVAVKIQYPAIRDVIENDFKILKTATLPAKLTGHVPKVALDELERGILEETDYLNEADNIERFHDGLASLPYLTVPVVHRKLSSATVLTMSLLEGQHLSDFVRSGPPQALRDRVGTRLIELFCLQLHGVGAIHADPHPGNYLFTGDGDIRLLDFGCVKQLDPETTAVLRQFVHRTYRTRAGFDKLVRKTFKRSAKADMPAARRVMKQVIGLFEAIYPEHHTADDVIDFGKPDTLDMMRELWNSAFRDRQLGPEFIFINRAEMGISNLLHTLRARVATTHTVNGVIERLEAGR